MIQKKYFIIIVCIGLISCELPEVAENCGENVQRVVNLDFTGPEEIRLAPDSSTTFVVTIEIEKINPELPAIACYLVYDQDKRIRKDDLLTGGIVEFATSRTLGNGSFNLAPVNGRNICGLLDGRRRCSDERQAEVYIKPFRSRGSRSQIHNVRIIE